MVQSPGVPPYGDPRHRPPADPYPGYDPYRAQEPTHRHGGAGYHGGGGGHPQPGGRGHAAGGPGGHGYATGNPGGYHAGGPGGYGAGGQGGHPGPAAGGHPHPGPGGHGGANPYPTPGGYPAGYDDRTTTRHHRQGPPPAPSDPWAASGGPAGPAPYPQARPGYGGGGGDPTPPTAAAEPPSRRRRGPLVGVVVGLATLVVGLTAVGAWLLLRDPDRGGAPDPVAASQEFLQAVYRDLDPAAAAATVCSQSRDEAALSAKIEEIRDSTRTYVEPTYSWSPPQVVEETDERAVVAVTLTMATGDERMANLELRLTVLDKGSNGWWVCDVETGAGPAAGPPETPEPTGTPSPAAQEEGGE